MRYCPECGKKLLKDDVKFCPECGASLSKAAPAAEPRKAEEAKPEPKGPLRRYWAWTISVVLLIMLLVILLAAAGYSDDSLKKTRADNEARVTVQLGESKPLLEAQKKVLAGTAAAQYANAIQVDAMAIQQNANKIAARKQLNESEQVIVAHDLAVALKDAVDHCETGRILMTRERALLEATGMNVTQVIYGLDQMEAGVKQTAAGILAAAEKDSTEAEKKLFSDFFNILRGLG
ncbi:MAG: zinc ribbon domain-containing protein [Candidatus Micrarchaeota archaeon]|nr:zinc ribbon domain-containing protein [Candidatus Micrarchaeota archaeon]